jgi:ubiquinone/menaquinone biosynthesis C-methylase UbiE
MDSVLRRLTSRQGTPVERYWNRHTVNSSSFESPARSEEYLEWRFGQYPLFRELMGLWGERDGETVLDYGCGPGDDVTGFLLYTGARRVVGADISHKALGLTAARLALHGVDPERYELLQLSDAEPGLPLSDGSVDYVHCGGVVQHTTSPELVLRELARVLRPGGRGRIMVYNRDSLYFHLYTAYTRRILDGAFAGLTADEAFARNTDGPKCPISRAFRSAEFCELAERAGFEAEFLGGYYADIELDLWRDTGADALAEPRLAGEHKDFLRRVTNGADGYPRFEGSYVGVGGVYRVTRPDE